MDESFVKSIGFSEESYFYFFKSCHACRRVMGRTLEAKRFVRSGALWIKGSEGVGQTRTI